MTAGVVTVGGFKYAAGLYWQPSVDKNASKAARSAAKQPGFQAEYFCVRPGTKSQPVAQFGLGIAAAGHKSGMPSLAANLANQQPGSWVGAFRVTEGIFFIAVRDDLIDPEGDAWYAHDDDAHSRLEQEIARGGLTNIYCPSEWGVSGGENIGITSLLTGRRDVALQDVGIPKSVLYLTLLLLVVGGLAYGGYSYWQYQENARIAREAAELQAQINARTALAGPAQYPKIWQDAPLPMQYLKSCEEALSKLQAEYLGWIKNNVQCSGNALSVTWARDGKGFAEIPDGGKAGLDINLASASSSVAMQDLQPRGPEALAHFGLIDQSALHHNWPVTFSALPDDVVQVPENQPPPPPPMWRKRSVVYMLNTAPWLRPDLFESVPGLIITAVRQTNSSNYSVEGIIYEKKQPE
jgi:hypothetical protein